MDAVYWANYRGLRDVEIIEIDPYMCATLWHHRLNCAYLDNTLSKEREL